MKKGLLWSTIYQLFLVGTVLGIFTFKGYQENHHFSLQFARLLDFLPKLGDAQHYLVLSEHGYFTEGNARILIVFLPFYPLLIRGVASLTHDSLIAALIITQITSILGHAFFWKILEIWQFETRVIVLSFLLLCVMPHPLVFVGVNTEGIYFFLATSCILLISRGRYRWAAVVSALASATRMVGLFLAIPIFLQKGKTLLKKTNLKLGLLELVGLALISISGFVVYLGMNAKLYGSFFYFTNPMRSNWYKSIELPWINYWNNLKFFIKEIRQWDNPSLKLDYLAIFLFPILFLVQFLWSHRRCSKPERAGRIPLAIYVWCLAQWILFCSQSFWLSSTRYLSLLFPVYPMVASLVVHSKILSTLLFLVATALCAYGLWTCCNFGWWY